MTFEVAGAAYDAFMGRWSTLLAGPLADLAGVAPGQSVLDVGCGPGALTGELVDRVGADHVVAVDPSEPFVDAVAARLPGVDVRRAAAEALPFQDAAFDRTVAQLVVHFMSEPVAGLREMARVTVDGGTVAATVWDHVGGGPLTTFWTAVRELDPRATDESDLPGVREGHLPALLAEAGLAEVSTGVLEVSRAFGSVEEWWEPYTLGVGPAGDHVARLDERGRERLLDRCRALLPEPPFELTCRAWWATGVVRRPGR